MRLLTLIYPDDDSEKFKNGTPTEACSQLSAAGKSHGRLSALFTIFWISLTFCAKWLKWVVSYFQSARSDMAIERFVMTKQEL
jgi:hypothetical protein